MIVKVEADFNLNIILCDHDSSMQKSQTIYKWKVSWDHNMR